MESRGEVDDAAAQFTINRSNFVGALVVGVDTQGGDSGSPYVGWNTGTAQSGDYKVYGAHNGAVFRNGVEYGTVFRVADITLQLGGYPVH